MDVGCGLIPEPGCDLDWRESKPEYRLKVTGTYRIEGAAVAKELRTAEQHPA
jgi:hypothetical protein